MRRLTPSDGEIRTILDKLNKYAYGTSTASKMSPRASEFDAPEYVPPAVEPLPARPHTPLSDIQDLANAWQNVNWSEPSIYNPLTYAQQFINSPYYEAAMMYPGVGSVTRASQAPKLVEGVYPYSRLSMGGIRQGLENIFPQRIGYKNIYYGSGPSSQIGIEPKNYREFNPAGLAEEAYTLHNWLQNLPGYGGVAESASPSRMIADAIVRGDVRLGTNVLGNLFSNSSESK